MRVRVVYFWTRLQTVSQETCMCFCDCSCLYDFIMLYCSSLKLWGYVNQFLGFSEIHEAISKTSVHFCGGQKGVTLTNSTNKYTDHFHTRY